MSRVQGKEKRGAPRSFLTRLRREKSGNVFAIVAVSIVPIAGMMGGAVDLSRAYLVQARMQQACDAGALAGRKSMAGTTLTTADKNEAYKYFFYNFPSATMGSDPLTQDNPAAENYVTVTKSTDNQLQMRAATNVPTTLLRILGNEELRVAVACKGEEYYVNTDIMFVLDTTGSMNCAISDPVSCGQATEKSNSKMRDMRGALKQLYGDLMPAQAALNAKNLRMRFGFVQYSSTVNVGKLVRAQNANYVQTTSKYYSNTSGSQNTVAHSNSWFTNTWNGCIEERQSVNTITATTTSIPSAAYDLDITTLPSSEATKWIPHDPTAELTDYTADPAFNACPRPASHLALWPSQSAFNTHVDTINTGIGGTYHDTGMIWGTRMIANTGIFANLNPNTYNGVKVARTIVFMTDGLMSPNGAVYGSYSVEDVAARIAPKGTSDANLKIRHEKRFNLMCNRAKELGVSVWVVAISSGLSQSLTDCATSGQAVTVNNTAQLTEAFKRIADKVGNLRLGA